MPGSALLAKAQADLESLFGLKAGKAAGSPSTADAAKSELDRLFSLDKKK